MKTIEQAIVAASKCLAGVGIENPRMESEFLISAFLQIPRTHLILERHKTLPTQKIRAFRGWLREREKRKPLAYVSGEQPFRDLNLKVSTAVLVPRPETELLVERALMLLGSIPHPNPLPSRERASEASGEGLSVVDVGTGSGNIALSLAKHPRVRRVIAIDRSAAALRVAKENAKFNFSGSPVQWIQGNLLTPLLKHKTTADLIVANLPYVRTNDMDALDPELQWEPRLALDGGEDGLRFIDPCIQQAKRVLAPGGMILLEIGFDQSREVTSLFKNDGAWTDVHIFSDFAGLPRIAQARKQGI